MGNSGLDYEIIAGIVKQGASVLDLGCGEGDLLALLIERKQVRGQGIEIDAEKIYACVAKGLSVLHGDLDTGLTEYADKSFDYVILNQTLQQVKKPDVVLREALRVGKRALVGFPNFAHYSARLQIFFKGRTPVTPALPFEWHDTPNLHFLSILDFICYCDERGIRIEDAYFITKNRRVRLLPNLFAETGIFLISREGVIQWDYLKKQKQWT